MRKLILAIITVAVTAAAGIVPAAASGATLPARRTVWGVTGFATVVNIGTVNWPRKLYGTRAAADAHLAQVQALQIQVCPLAPVACSRFVVAPVSIA